jgi:predicted  nucleic acid-binding Zn-ribbon protein
MSETLEQEVARLKHEIEILKETIRTLTDAVKVLTEDEDRAKAFVQRVEQLLD